MKNIVISGLAVLFVIIIISCLGATGIKRRLKYGTETIKMVK